MGGSGGSFVGQVLGKFDALVVDKFGGALMGSSDDGVVGWLVGRAIGSIVGALRV